MKQVILEKPIEDTILAKHLDDNAILGMRDCDDSNIKGYLVPIKFYPYTVSAQCRKYRLYSSRGGVSNGNGWDVINGKDTYTRQEFLDWCGKNNCIVFSFATEPELYQWLAKE